MSETTLLKNWLQSFVQMLRDYWDKVRAFCPNARLFLLNVILTGISMGVFRLLFNFYVLSLGFDEALVGRLISVSSTTALISALPMGYLADILGRKYSLVLGGLLTAFSVVGVVIWPTEPSLYGMNVFSGLGQGLWGITMSPFLMENSGEKERTYLFSFSQGLQMLSAFFGNAIGGYLPGMIGRQMDADATSSSAYGWSLVVVAATFALGIAPLFRLRRQRLESDQRSVFAPIKYAVENPALLGKLIMPLLITSIGAGLVMPFMNVFYRVVHHQSDPVIGNLFAWGSLAMGVGLLIAPPLADRFGKIPIVVVTQALSVPFLALLGFSPLFWISAGAYYVRLALMNMSTPVYQTFVMERVDASARGTVASLSSMAWNFGWALSPALSGYLQVNYGFGPAFVITITLYTVAISMYWAFFWRKQPERITNGIS